MLLELALVSIFVLIIGLLLTKLNIPLIAAYVLSGLLAQIILQAFFRGSVSVASFSSLADIGVVLLMFTLGVEFPLKKVFRLKSRIIYLTILQVLLCSAVLSVIFIVFKYQINSAIVFGILFAFSSTVIVAKFLSEHGLVHEEAGEMSLGILILQDMLIIPVSILLPLFLNLPIII